MADCVELWLPYPPSVNSLYKRSRGGGVFKSPEARVFLQQVQYAHGWRMPQSGDIKVSIDLYRPRKTGDIDNTLKVLLDSLQGIAYHNDKQIVELGIRRLDDRKSHPDGAARVRIAIADAKPARTEPRRPHGHPRAGLRLQLARQRVMVRVG